MAHPGHKRIWPVTGGRKIAFLFADGSPRIRYRAIRPRRRGPNAILGALRKKWLECFSHAGLLLRWHCCRSQAHFSYLFSRQSNSRAQGASCEDGAGLGVLTAPFAPWKGAPLRILFAAEKPVQGELSLIAPDGSVAAKSRELQGGPPYFWFAEIVSPAAGTWHARLALDGATAGCSTITRDIAVRDDAPPPPHAMPGNVWPLRNTWNRATENLYSAWI